jgi:hypothetical protein
MKSNELNKLLAPFKLLSNRAALSQTYRSLQISYDRIRGCSNFAVLEIATPLMNDDQPSFCVDAAAFMAVISSLPDKQEVALTADEGVMIWECGQAKGRLALLPEVKMPVIERKTEKGRKVLKWKPPESFRIALEVGGLSCGNDSMASSGMFGILIDNRTVPSISACDGATISHATIQESKIPNMPDQIVIAPDAAELLRLLLKDGGGLEFDDKSIYYASTDVKCLIKQLPKLKHDIADMLAKYVDAEIIAAVPRDRISAFIKRVGALTENKRTAHVSLGASQGRMSLSFSEGTASSDEYYLVDKLEIPDLPEVQLDAGKTARALRFIDEVVLDHVERHVVVLRGTSVLDEGDDQVDFIYLVSGRR